MSPIARFSAAFIVATVAVQTAVLAQGLEVRRHNPSERTKGRFSEVVTVNGQGRTSLAMVANSRHSGRLPRIDHINTDVFGLDRGNNGSPGPGTRTLFIIGYTVFLGPPTSNQP
jgi:hypothetical protein